VQYLRTFFVGVVVFGIAAIVVGAVVVPPDHASAAQRLVISLEAFAVTAAAVIGLASAVAFVAAPYQQRNALRRDLAAAGTQIAAMRSEPVSPGHAEKLKQVAANLKKRLDEHTVPAYGISPSEDTVVWRDAFHQHFPDLQPLLTSLEDERAAITAFQDRLEQETADRGMNHAPWLPDQFVPVIVSVTERRSMTRFLAGQLSFDWHEAAGSIYWGNPADGAVVLSAIVPDQIAKNKWMFESLVRDVQSWPEAAGIRISCDNRRITREAVIQQLEVIALKEKFTTRCQLCR
jgi:cytochrome c556